MFANAGGHLIEWSVQSVTQYDTADPKNPTHHNKVIWGFSSANPTSAYVNRYHVRFGSAENSAAKIGEDGVLSVRYSHQRQSYGWIRGMAGWP